MTKTISILGCGWLGLPLAQYLINKGWNVKGTTTSEHKIALLQSEGIEPYLMDITEPQSFNADFFSANYYVVNIPPSKAARSVNSYHTLIKQLQQSADNKVIFISSTSVYPNNNKTVKEDATITISEGNNAILDIERLFEKANFKTSIIRFGGLVGGNRYPGRFFRSNTIIDGANNPINLIHLDDCIRITERILDLEKWNETYNGVADTHPTKKEFYTLAARLKEQSPPQFSDKDINYKITDNQKIKDELNLRLRHPDLLEMLNKKELWQQS